jgi:hypothetical protein
VLQSAEDWSKVMHAAPTMGTKKPMQPAAGFWSDKAVLMVARVTNAGAKLDRLFKVSSLRRDGDSLDLAYTFSPSGKASSTMKSYLAVITRKPLPKDVHFIEGGQTICTIPTGG